MECQKGFNSTPHTTWPEVFWKDLDQHNRLGDFGHIAASETLSADGKLLNLGKENK
jgi:hypothetical protein